MRLQQSEFRRIVVILVSTAVAMWIILYAPTPYVVYEPGLAVPVEPMISIEEGDSSSQGVFLLTAVKLTEPNFLDAIKAMWDANKDVHLKKDVFRGYSKEQYANRLTVIMQGSQNNAVEAAYRHAGLPYANEVQAIVVSDVSIKDAADSTSFKAGDTLLGLTGGKRFFSIEEAAALLNGVGTAEHISFDVKRGEELLTVTVPGEGMNSSLTADRLPEALGVTGLTELRSLEPADSSKRLSIAAGEIGGPSAGLVFALKALDLLTEGDLTGSHRIAATGTISVDGEVGAIGGVRQKVVVTSEEGAELFLVPAGNYEEAKEKAESLGTSMQVVSVTSLQEAIESISDFAKNE